MSITAESMGKSLENGVVRIARKGLVKFAFGDGPEFQIDVIAVYDEWWQADASMRTDGKLPTDKQVAWNETRRAFVQNIAAQAARKSDPACDWKPALSMAEVGEFMARLNDEVEKLRPFFAPTAGVPPSSPENTGLRFSQ